jgi:hypothetical protein
MTEADREGRVPAGDLLPIRSRRDRRRSSFRRRRMLAGVVVGVVAIAMVALVTTSGSGDDASAEPGSSPSSKRTRATTSSTTTVTEVSSTTRATEPVPPVEPEASNVDEEPEPPEPPVTPEPGFDDIQAGVTITTARCAYDPESGSLTSSGRISNRNADGYRVYFQVSWLADDGYEVSGAADQDWVEADDAVDWELVGSADEPPNGLRCEASVEVQP